MSMIDDFASRENITKAAVITRALDCMQASYDSGNGGMPVTGSGSGASEQEINDLKNQLKQAEERAQAAEQRANDAVMARDAAEAKARDTATELAAEQAKASLAAAIPQVAPAADTAELDRLKELVAKQEASLEEKTKALAAKEAEVAAKEAQLAERDARITSLSEQLGAANAKAQLASTAQVVSTAPVEGGGSPGEDSARALTMLNMLGGVMGAFQQQVDDARQVGEQEGREAVQKDLEDMLNRARNDGYRDAMTYLDDRVTTARGRRKGRKGPYRKHGILRASTLFEGSPNLKEAFTYTRFHHLPRLPHFPYNTQAAPYPPSGAAFLRPQTVPMRQLLRAIVSLAGGCGRPSAEEKPAANLRSKTRGTLPWEGSKVGRVRCRFWCQECAGGLTPWHICMPFRVARAQQSESENERVAQSKCLIYRYQ